MTCPSLAVSGCGNLGTIVLSACVTSETILPAASFLAVALTILLSTSFEPILHFSFLYNFCHDYGVSSLNPTNIPNQITKVTEITKLHHQNNVSPTPLQFLPLSNQQSAKRHLKSKLPNNLTTLLTNILQTIPLPPLQSLFLPALPEI